jgi:hypothetical protein
LLEDVDAHDEIDAGVGQWGGGQVAPDLDVRVIEIRRVVPSRLTLNSA